MRFVTPIVSVILTAAIVGAFEGVRVIGVLDGGLDVGGWFVVSTLACAAAIGPAAVLHAIGWAFVRVPPFAAWARAVSDGGERVVAVWRAALVGGTLLAIAAATFVVASRAHDGFRFVEGPAMGLVLASVVTVGIVLVAVVALAVDRQIAPRLAGSAMLRGRRIWFAVVPAVLVVTCGPAAIAHVVAPAVELDAILIASVLVVAVVTGRVWRFGSRRGAPVAAAVVVVGCGVGVWQLTELARARSFIVVRGVFSYAGARTMWALADRDGDGYAPVSAGGPDCDDSDAHRNPTAREIAGNGIDENCTGRDVAVATLAARDAARPSAAAPHHNVVLITIDALRADRLGAYGYTRPTSPALDAFAASAARFVWAMTSCPATRCSVPALLSGRLPSVMDPAAPTLATVLRDAGWDTASITCCERFGLGNLEAAGFTHVDTSADSYRVRRGGQSNADVVADRALQWLQLRPKAAPPFLLWLHFYDPHHPYAAPTNAGRFGASDADRYDAEIAFTDYHVGRVLAALDPNTTVVAISADHGDEFGEHGTRFHARSLFNQAVRVPLLMRYPGAPPRVEREPVSLVDIMPTLLELVGVNGPAGMNGRSLAAAVRSPQVVAPARPILIELVPVSAIRRNIAAVAFGTWKIIWDRDANAWSLFSLVDDPADKHDRSTTEPEVLAAMQQRLFDALDAELAKR